MDPQPIRVQVEVISPEVVDRLEKDNQLLRQEIKQLRDQHEALRRTVYRIMDIVGELRKGKGTS